MIYRGLNTLITGASSGLGEEFARQLAEAGSNLVLVARTEDKLKRLAESLEHKCGVTAIVIAADLASAEAVDRLVAEVKGRQLKIELLINTAGFGLFENFIDVTLERQLNQIDVNIRALVALTHAFTADMVNAGHGGIINLASTAAFQPLPGANVYAASKAFVLSFSEALAFELQASNVQVTVACPGPIATSFFADKNPKLQPREMDQPAVIVKEILQAFTKGKRVVIPESSQID